MIRRCLECSRQFTINDPDTDPRVVCNWCSGRYRACLNCGRTYGCSHPDEDPSHLCPRCRRRHH